jgi:hypothetical protein
VCAGASVWPDDVLGLLHSGLMHRHLPARRFLLWRGRGHVRRVCARPDVHQRHLHRRPRLQRPDVPLRLLPERPLRAAAPARPLHLRAGRAAVPAVSPRRCLRQRRVRRHHLHPAVVPQRLLSRWAVHHLPQPELCDVRNQRAGLRLMSRRCRLHQRRLRNAYLLATDVSVGLLPGRRVRSAVQPEPRAMWGRRPAVSCVRPG